MSDDQDLLSTPVDTWPKGTVRNWLAQDPALQGLVEVLQVYIRYLSTVNHCSTLIPQLVCRLPLRLLV